MNTIDPMVSALIALCKAQGGEKFVADKAAVSAENLLQITKGVKLPSGNPRGVGPGLRAKITKAFPSWLQHQTPSPNYKQNQALAPIDKAQAATNSVATLGQTLESLAGHLEAMDIDTRRKAILLISDLATDPKSHAATTAMIELSIRSKNQKAA